MKFINHRYKFINSNNYYPWLSGYWEIAPQQVNLNLFNHERPLAVKPKQDGNSTENESVKLLARARVRDIQGFLHFCCHKCHTLHHSQLIIKLLSNH